MANGFSALDSTSTAVEILTEQIIDPDLGITGAKQYVGIEGGAGSTNKLAIDSSGRIGMTDGGTSLTVDAPVGTPVFVRLSDGTVALIGQKAMAGSVPVVIASDQSVIPINDNGGSLTVDGTVAVSSGPAAARTTDSISAALAIDALMNGLSVLAPNFSGITASASGATTLVAAVASKKIRVHGLFIVCAAAVTLDLQSHTTTATKTGSMPFAANGGMVVSFSPTGWFETVAGEALDINLGGAVAVGGQLIYTTV